jgi:hypothetical protein
MANDKIELSLAAERFAIKMEEARLIAKAPELFQRSWSSRDKTDEICVLRRWNSHTPSVWNAWGGGYFIKWRNKGTIIDPGCSFIRLFRSQTPYEIGDINMVITTHDHVDHCQDFGTLISLFREYNKWLDNQDTPQPPKTWDLLMSHGVANHFNSLLVHPENAPFFRWNKVLPPEEVEWVQPLPSIARGKSHEEMSKWEKHLSAYTAFCQNEISQDYQYQLKLLPTKHKELLGSRTSLGLQFEFLEGGPTVIISGDTGFDDDLDLAQYCRQADLLILHVGTMESTDRKPLPEHLGLDGVTRVLASLKGTKLEETKLKLVVLTEWGYEFGRLRKPGELGGRSRFTKLVEDRLREMGCDLYFAAVYPDHAEGKIPVIPADVSLRISLPDLNVWSEDGNNGKGGFVAPDRIWAEDKGDEITFRTIA